MSVDPFALNHGVRARQSDLFRAVIQQARVDAFRGVYVQASKGSAASERREAVLFLIGGGEWQAHRNFIADLAGEDGDCVRDRTLQAFRVFESIFQSVGALSAAVEAQAQAVRVSHSAQRKRPNRLFSALEKSAALSFELPEAA
jgi:hypothetical protein